MELEELNRDYLGMIENSYDAMTIVDNASRLLLVNPAFERLMGIKRSEAKDVTCLLCPAPYPIIVV